MNQERLNTELDVATDEFLKSYNSFRDAALRLLNIMRCIRKIGDESIVPSSSMEERNIKEFMIQMMGENDEVVKNSFGIRYLSEEELD